MASKPPRPICQFSGDTETFRERLQQLFGKVGLERVRIAVAYARWDGLGLISDRIMALLSANGRFEAVYGAGNGVTTADALYFGVLLKRQFPANVYAGFVEDKYANAAFHPKFYQFQYRNETVVVVGSANLTGGGLCRNDELGLEFAVTRGSAEEQEWEKYWKRLRKMSAAVTPKAILALAARPGAGNEKRDEVGGAKAGKPYLNQTKPAPKPLFDDILRKAKLPRKAKEQLLGEMSALTDKPKRLYLQVFERETGGDKGKPGSAVQFPVATLGAFFGISDGDNPAITIDFPDQTVTSHFMHPKNNTHRLRLAPILAVKRPAVLILDRVGDNRYKAAFAPNYKSTLKNKCPEQRDSRSRKWGFE